MTDELSLPTIVDGAWLQQHGDDARIRVIDVRSPQEYARAHIPNAVNVPAVFFAGPMGDPPAAPLFGRLMTQAGMQTGDAVVVVDDGGGVMAARVAWVLRAYGHQNVSVVDGGMATWQRSNGPMTTERREVAATAYAVRALDDRVFADFDATVAALHEGQALVLDVRSPAEYAGMDVRSARGGHIPGAILVDWTSNLSAGDDGVPSWRSPDELRQLYREAGLEPDREVIVYCQSGMRASATFVALRWAGYQRVRLYPRGWGEWGNRDDAEIET